MNWQIDHPCPQCGGPVVLDEGDRVLSCPFCRIRLNVMSKGPFRYCLVSEDAKKEMIYLPYWRFKGTLYSAIPYEVKPQLLDASILASETPFAPRTMGLRTQVQHLQFATKTIEGLFVPPKTPFKEALGDIEKQLEGARVTPRAAETTDKAYIGESTSIIYAPYYIENGQLYDAVLNKPCGRLPEEFKDINSFPRISKHWEPKFLPALCPKCGWDLEGHKDTCIFLCKNCDTAWKTKQEKMVPVTVETMEGNEKNVVYLPFWTIRAKVEGLQLETYADLVRVANLPKAITQDMEETLMSFWIPAFKVHPHLFLRLARQVTSSPFTGKVNEEVPKLETHPVNLPLAEAAQSVKIALVTFARPTRTIFHKLPSINITPTSARLVFVPFSTQGPELVQNELNFAVSKQALHHGRNL